jgi:hypothetical protein
MKAMSVSIPVPLGTLLQRRDELLDEVVEGRHLLRHWAGLTLLMTLASATYGAVLGAWQGGILVLYVAAKLPLVLILTSAFTMVFNWLVAILLGSPLAFGQVAVLTFMALSVGSVLLASLAPVAWFFTISSPDPTLAARTTHNLLYLMHTGFVGACSLAGTRFLWAAMRRIAPSAVAARRVYLLWILAYALVGGEVAWALRPFVGSIYHPVTLVRPDALDGNVYEFIVVGIVPYLFSQGR